MNKLFAFLLLTGLSVNAHASLSGKLGEIAIQDGGRTKPFSTFANESLRLLYGKSKYNGKSATEVVFTWALLPGHWNDIEFIEVVRKDLKENLNLDVGSKYFSPKTVLESSRLSLVMQELESKRAAKEKLDPYFQSIQRLEGQLNLFQAIATGVGLRFLPPKTGTTWVSVAEFDEDWRERFRVLSQGFVESIKGDGNQENLTQGVKSFIAAAKAENPSLYPSDEKIGAEILYNDLHPFRWAWIGYLMASLLFLIYLFSERAAWGKAGWVFIAGAFLLHNLGFALRIYLTERPPVSNMYESVIWVAWGAIVFAGVFEWLHKRVYYIFAAAIVSVICMIAADVAPNILDPTLQPLQPVLRSNLWLIVHVMTITLGYSAFFLSMIISDVGLIFYMKDEKRFKNRLIGLVDANYRSVQVGVVLLAAGTILGGVWADYSWGRFWGWDPKETWAFIALMGYVAVLHGRLSGWLRDFGFLCWSVVCFSLVIMAWYGVNFVLGAGLHSYGFGGGGIEYVSSFVVIQFIFVLAAVTVRQSRLKKSG